MARSIHTPLVYCKGVGPAKAGLFLSELNCTTLGDLLGHYPFRYVDKSRFFTVSEVNSDTVFFQLKCIITELKEEGIGPKKRLVGRFRDHTGTMDLVWFRGVQVMKKLLPVGQEVVVFGKPTAYRQSFNMPHPEVEPVTSDRVKLGSGLKPVYPTTEKLAAKGLASNGIEKVIAAALAEGIDEIEENLPDFILEKYRLADRRESLIRVHQPTDQSTLDAAIRRLKFEELFMQQLGLMHMKVVQTVKTRGAVFGQIGPLFNGLYGLLPFQLTEAQKRVLREIRQDVGSGHHMNRLVQGDVGSGKTLVALLSAMMAADNGFQTCLMAPTEILANQHFNSLKKMLSELPIGVELLTGSTKSAERKVILQRVKTGDTSLLIGTHALIEPTVEFARLGLAIIDEQHRFGVAQRSELWKKASPPPHILVMTATPIPRTLAMTVYGDLDLSVINELPPGRQAIETIHKTDSSRLWVNGLIEKQVREGRQAYIVYPLIEESEALDHKALTEGYEALIRRFPPPEFRISIVHGRVKPEVRDEEMRLFVQGKTNIMVATTVIEVGVDVPNASLMVIESAERFGLSQLHQLRGRVGRGAAKSYCVLMTKEGLSQDAFKRVQTMVRTTDGFQIAETDMELRGPGELTGTKQSGMIRFKLADLIADRPVLEAARQTAADILTADPDLTDPQHARLKKHLSEQVNRLGKWVKIS
jgi:ATP-dependent DNA helicase RecG